MIINITEDEAQQIVWNDSDDYYVVDEECNLNHTYKDYCPSTTIVKSKKDGKYFALNWEKYVSYYGSGDHQYNDLCLYEVEEKEETKTITVKIWANVKDAT
jgi:hypothetical protein